MKQQKFPAERKRDAGRVATTRGYGSEFRGEAFKQWGIDNNVVLQHIQPGKPMKNAFIARVNRTLREEVRDQHLFSNREEDRETTHWWIIADNASRPDDGLDSATADANRCLPAKRSTFDLSA